MSHPKPVFRAGRTPLFGALRRLMALARMADRPGAPTADELPDLRRDALSRRDYLKATALTLSTAATALGARPARRPKPPHGLPSLPLPPRVAIVGDGIAGLNAAHVLARSGIRATVYGATDRLGGRVASVHGLLGPGLTTELGGEFINSNHRDMLQLVREFGLELLDSQTDPGTALREAYVFGGRHYSEAQIIDAFRPVAARMAADLTTFAQPVSAFRHNAAAVRLDQTSLREYLLAIGATGAIFDMLRLAYVAEYGLDDDQQSSLNLLSMINPDTSDGLDLVGDSDERYRIAGGNSQLVETLAGRLGGQVESGHALVSLRAQGNGFGLTFQVAAGGVREVAADFVILAIPFTSLRQVDLRVPLPARKVQAIQQLGYGTNSKVLIGFHHRPWRDQGFNGGITTDAGFQIAWDNSGLQPVDSGGLTLLPGGAAGVAVGQRTPADQGSLALPGIDEAFPGALASLNGLFGRAYWPGEPFITCSYACYTPGQWTTISGLEGQPVGNLFFAGEHCSLDNQGYMDGAAQTGRLAANALLARLRGR